MIRKRFYLLTGMILFFPLLFCHCYWDIPVVPPPEFNRNHYTLEMGYWVATSAILMDNDNSADVYAYFKNFKVNFGLVPSKCITDNDECWCTIRSWSDNTNVFENEETTQTMQFTILEVFYGEDCTMDVLVETAIPGFTFIPPQICTGRYLITLRKERCRK